MLGAIRQPIACAYRSTFILTRYRHGRVKSHFRPPIPLSSSHLPNTQADDGNDTVFEETSSDKDAAVDDEYSGHVITSSGIVSSDEYVEDDFKDKTFKRGKRGPLFDDNIARLFRVCRSAKNRLHNQFFVMEGPRSITDVISQGIFPKAVIYTGTEGETFFRSLMLEKVSSLRVSERDMSELCVTKHPQSAAAVFKIPTVTDRCDDPIRALSKEVDMYRRGDYARWLITIGKSRKKPVGPRMPFVLLCDAIRDPNNLGTLIRSAVAAGCQAVISIGCVDTWNPRVVRCSAGGVLQVPIIHATWHTVEELISHNRQVLISAPTRGMIRLEEVANLPVHQQDEYKSFLLKLPKTYHKSADWGSVHSGGVLIISNEARGVSLKALDFAMRRPCQQVCVPVTPGIDSLNAAMAGTVLLFEAISSYQNIQRGPSTKHRASSVPGDDAEDADDAASVDDAEDDSMSDKDEF